MPPTARSQSKSDPSLPIKPADEPLLRVLLRYHLATPSQVGSACYAKGALTTAYTRLRRLAQGGHVLALDMYKPARVGSGHICYALGKSGLKHLSELGVSIQPHYRLFEAKPYSYLFLSHWIALTDVLLSIDQLANLAPELTVETMIHDRELKHTPVPVRVAGRTETLVPDAWLRLLLSLPDGRRFRLPIAPEVDMGTHERKSFQHTIRKYLAGYGDGEGPLLAAFGVTGLIVPFVTPLGHDRAAQLVSWIEGVLQEDGQEDKWDLFAVTGVDASTVTPRQFLPAPIWLRPFDPEPVPLAELFASLAAPASEQGIVFARAEGGV